MRRKTWLVTLKGPKWMSWLPLWDCCFDDDDDDDGLPVEGSAEVLIVIFPVAVGVAMLAVGAGYLERSDETKIGLGE